MNDEEPIKIPLRKKARVLLRKLRIQRRRVAILCLGLVLAAVIRIGLQPMALLALIPAVAIASVMVCRACHFRRATESLALGALIMALSPAPDVGLIVLIPAGTYLGFLMLYGRWWDWTPLRVKVTSTRRARLPVPIEDLWAALVPGEGPPAEFWTGTLIDYEVDPEDPMTRYLRHDRPAELPAESTITFVEWCWQSSCRYIIEEVVDGPADDAEVTISFDPIGEADTVVESVFVQSGLSPRLALRRWLDGRIGDEWDIFSTRVSRTRNWSFHGPASEA